MGIGTGRHSKPDLDPYMERRCGDFPLQRLAIGWRFKWIRRESVMNDTNRKRRQYSITKTWNLLDDNILFLLEVIQKKKSSVSSRHFVLIVKYGGMKVDPDHIYRRFIVLCLLQKSHCNVFSYNIIHRMEATIKRKVRLII